MRQLTARQLAEEFGTLIEERRKQGATSEQLGAWLADHFDVYAPSRKVRHAIRYLLAEDLEAARDVRLTVDQQDEDHQTLESKGHIKTLEELLDTCQVDLDLWRVDRYVVNKWDQHAVETGLTQLFQVKAWLVRRADVVNWNAMRDELLSKLESRRPAPRIRKPEGKHMLEIDMSDLHVDKRPYTGERSLDEVGDETMSMLVDLLSQVEHLNIVDYTLVIGNDLLNAEFNGKTPKGTEQDVFVNYRDAFTWTFDMKLAVIDMLRERGRVRGIVVEGNHDPHATFSLGIGLDRTYRNDKDVTFDVTPSDRKYYSWGVNSFCYVHKPGAGGLKNMPALVGAETKGGFYATPFRFIKLGDQHRRQDGLIQTYAEDKGIQWQFMRSLSVVDKWHHSKGYQSLRGMDGSVYHIHRGPRGNFPAFLED